jgi:hypothetical protein
VHKWEWQLEKSSFVQTGEKRVDFVCGQHRKSEIYREQYHEVQDGREATREPS